MLMRKKLRVICRVLLLMLCLFLSIFHGRATNESELDFQTQSIEYWSNIMKDHESDISYCVEWFQNNKKSIYGTQVNLDSRIKKFLKENNIDIASPDDLQDENFMLFTYEFYVKKRITGNYVLIYCKDEKKAQDSDSPLYAVQDDYHYKIKNNYYCYVTFYQ